MKKYYTPVSFTFVALSFVALLMNQNGYMVIAFAAAVLLCFVCAYMDYERDVVMDELRAELKMGLNAQENTMRELKGRVDSLTTTVGLKNFGR